MSLPNLSRLQTYSFQEILTNKIVDAVSSKKAYDGIPLCDVGG